MKYSLGDEFKRIKLKRLKYVIENSEVKRIEDFTSNNTELSLSEELPNMSNGMVYQIIQRFDEYSQTTSPFKNLAFAEMVK